MGPDTEQICCICGEKFIGWGNNPWPLNTEEDARCCDDCNNSWVLAARLGLHRGDSNGKK